MHEYLTYVGKLSDFDDSEKKRLLTRIESLLFHQFGFPLVDSKIEQKALIIVGKLKQKTSGLVSLQKAGVGSVTSGCISELTPEFSIKLNTLKSETHRSIGVEWLCHQAITELGILDYLSQELSWSKEECGLFELSLLGRLIHRGSERSTANWLATGSGSIELQSSKVVVHREALRLSALSLQTIQEPLENFLYDRIMTIMKEDSSNSPINSEKFYYDLSNVHFEGRMQQSDLAQFGHDKKKRKDKRLVSYSLLTNEQGIIKKSQVYPGNVSEPSTFEQQIQGVNKQTILFCDAGIATKENIYYLLKNDYRYMCAAREGFSQFSMDFEGAHQLEHHCSNGDKYQVWLKSEQHQITIEGKVYTEYLLFVKSEGKQVKEDGIIAKQKEKFIAGLEAIQASLAKLKGHKSIAQIHQRIGRLKQKYSKVQRAFKLELTDDGKNINTLKWSYNSQREERNGTYIVRTSEPVTDLHLAWKTYNGLATIEEINRSCKTDIKIRPIHHKTDDNIQAHLNLGFLATNIVRYIRLKLAKKGIHHSWQTILNILNQQHSNIITFSNKKQQWIWVNNWTEPDEQMLQIYNALNYKPKAHEGFFFQTNPKTG